MPRRSRRKPDVSPEKLAKIERAERQARREITETEEKIARLEGYIVSLHEDLVVQRAELERISAKRG